MSERFDVVILGAGPGGRGAASKLVDAGKSVAMLEGELVGGECPFWACIPTKGLLRPVEASEEARRVPGLDAPDPRWAEVREYRDYLNSGLDDASKVESYRDMGIEVIKDFGRITGARPRAGRRPRARGRRHHRRHRHPGGHPAHRRA